MKRSKRFLSFVMAMIMVSTMVFTNVSFADEAAEAAPELTVDEAEAAEAPELAADEAEENVEDEADPQEVTEEAPVDEALAEVLDVALADEAEAEEAEETAETADDYAIMPVSTGTGPISVWDFGGVEESDASLYTNYVTLDFLENWEAVGDAASGSKGLFLNAGDLELEGGMTLNVVAKDRLYYNRGAGTRTNGSNGLTTTAYGDGYTADGMWYANGTGGDSRRCFTIADVKAGSEVKVYAGVSNTLDTDIHLTGGTQDDIVTIPGDTKTTLGKFITKEDGKYKIWFGATGKPIVNRIVITPPVTVSATVNAGEYADKISGFGVKFINETTGEEIIGTVSGNTATANLTPGYSYSATMTGATGYGFTNATRKFDVTTGDLLAGSKSLTFDVETKSTYVASGSVKGFAEGYDTSKLALTFVPEEGSTADMAKAEITGLDYSVTLEPDVLYTIELSGVNDYEITEGGTITGTANVTQDITVALKTLYTASGNIVGGATVTSLEFKNLDDNYTYTGTVEGSTYTASLRDGSYEVVAEAEGYVTHGHVVVSGSDVTKDILFVPTVEVPPVVDTSVKDIYVGVPGMTNNYDTMTEALKAAAVINPQSEADRVTINIAPGVYREQISVTTPYLTFKPYGKGDVTLTWYYGIGYRYYSVDSTGYYNVENAFDKFSRDTETAKWGVATYVKSSAKGFKAENINFESSFNLYITDEEIADGVTPTAGYPERTYATDPTTKTATERAAAIAVEADQVEFKDCTFTSSQDTLYMGDGTHTYYKNCVIQGNTDYIFGSGNALFDGCELRIGGYSDKAAGAYLTAGRSNNAADYKGYLFRSCTVTQQEGMLHTQSDFGRPWDANADITFLNTVLENAGTITPAGWTEMSGNKPQNAQFKEYGTVNADGSAVDTSARVGKVLTDEEAAAITPKETYLGWDATYYTEDTGAVEFATVPYFSTDGDVLLPHTGDTFTVKYDLGANQPNDASVIVYSLVDEAGQETVIKTTTAAGNHGVVLTNDMIGSYLKATVTPATIFGAKGTAASTVTTATISLGSGSVDTDRPSGKAVVFLAGDSTVKDYAAGAINNSGANLSEGSWGEFLKYFFNDSYEVMDYAQGGRSSRTFIDGTKADGSDRYFDKIKEQMTKGDYLFIQFGHNDSSASYQDRYTPVGTPDADGIFPATAPSAPGAGDGTYKWYMQQMIDGAKEAGATPVIVTPVSRMYFNSDGTIKSHHGDHDEYVIACRQLAEENGILCIDLYEHTKTMYEDAYKLDGSNGASALATRLFATGEKTHHSKLGGFAIAADLAEILQNSSLGLAGAIKAPDKVMQIADAKGNTEFTVNNSGVFAGFDRNAAGDFDQSIPSTHWTGYINDTLDRIRNHKSDAPTTETSTETSTAVTTETTTAVTTETTTKAPTTTTEAPTETTTQAPTETTTQAPTETTTEAPTETTTQAPTETTTEAPTVTTTEAPTTTTEAATEATTQASSSSGGSSSHSSSSGGSSGYNVGTAPVNKAETPGTDGAESNNNNAENNNDNAESNNNNAVNTDNSAAAGTLVPNVDVKIGSPVINVDGKSYTIDAAPYIQPQSSSTMVPIRFVAVALLGGDVEKADNSNSIVWDGAAKSATITKDGITIVFTAGSNIIKVNGEDKPMDYGVVAEIKDGRMYVPFRAIGEVLGTQVSWDQNTKSASYK